MEANPLLTAEPVEKVRFRRGCRAVYDADGQLLCGIDKKGIFDLNGKKIADYHRTEKRTERRGKDTVEYEILHYKGADMGEFRAENGYLHRGEERLGRIAPRDKRLIVLAAGLALACAFFIASILFTSLLGYAENDPFPTLTIRDEGGAWSADADLDIFGGKPVAPGSLGEYEFAIENPTQTRLEYTITLEILRDGENISFPFEYTLKMNNAAIASGNERGEMQVSGLQFEAESTHLFALAWEWPAEGNDSEDTQIGNEGGEITLSITITAQVAEGQAL